MYHYNELINKYGSPLYVYDLNKLENAYTLLKQSLPSNSIIYYSLKANPNIEITRELVKLGCYAEVSSKKELNIALKAGINAEKCLYTGPGKTYDEILFAVNNGVIHFSIESMFELDIMYAISIREEIHLRITLRINPKEQSIKASINMTGVSSQFGIEEEELKEDILQKFKSDYLLIEGIHIYNGSNFGSSNAVLENFKSAIDSVKRIQKKIGIKLKFVNLGGGFSAPYATEDKLSNYQDIRLPLQAYIDDKFPKNTSIAFESGRYLAATSGVLIGTVLNFKKSKGKYFCIVDFGINNLGGMSGLKRLPFKNIDIIPLVKKKGEKIEVSLVGPLCTPLDYIDRKIAVPRFTRGDRFYIPNVGAYGLTASLLGFLGRDIPKEIIIKNNKICVTQWEV
ncbi:decarboxylase [Oceanobacillus sp. CFH 90083]|uniref:decarboxylase n=1 Tax=Oceanobacillus sp. CFH 90083 TaxID=2592336 RepID=UPI00128C4071|nr:decarboxylase [Oceanobacillus sp. CFH 90083]